MYYLFFFSSRRRHTRCSRDWSSDVCSSDLLDPGGNVVKIYQGPPAIDRFEADIGNIPQTDAERLAKALPFPGWAESYDFGRNYLSLGFVFFERGYYEQSEAFFQQALKNDLASAEALYGLGSAFLQQNKSKEAGDCFEKALHLHARYPGTLDRKSTRLNSSHGYISYAVFCLKKNHT